MKKTMILMIVLLCLILVGCTNTKEVPTDTFDPYAGTTSGSEECLPHDAVRITLNSMSKYLEQKQKDNFSLDEWLPWEQFSALGEFHEAAWWDGDPESSHYEYLHTDSKTGKQYIYTVEFDRVPEDSGVTNTRQYFQWFIRWNPDRYRDDLMEITHTRTKKYFKNPDLTQYVGTSEGRGKEEDNDFYILDDVLYMCTSIGKTDSNHLQFYYDGWCISIYKDDRSDNNVPFNSAEDPEIIRRLTNTETYMDAIKELMDPKNAQTAK
jgi:hypothetical protein